MSLPKLRIKLTCENRYGTLSSSLISEVKYSNIKELDESPILGKKIVDEITEKLFDLVIYDLKSVGRSKSYRSFFSNGKKVDIKILVFLEGKECFNSDSFNSISKLLKLKFSEDSLEKINNLLMYMWHVNSLRDFYDAPDLLTEIQKARILEGMFSPKSRALAKHYFTNKNWSTKELGSVNQIIEQLRLKYGMDFLRAILSIEKGENGTLFASNKLMLLRPDSSTPDNFSIIHEGVEYILIEKNKSFRLAKRNSKFKSKNSISNNGERVWMDLSLVLYAKVFQDPLDYIIQYGIETGKCSFCGLPLEDPTSLLVGYGKICAEKNNLLWGQ